MFSFHTYNSSEVPVGLLGYKPWFRDPDFVLYSIFIYVTTATLIFLGGWGLRLEFKIESLSCMIGAYVLVIIIYFEYYP